MPAQPKAPSAPTAGTPRFTDVAAAGEGLTRPIVGRGIASGDFNNDGRPDLLIVDYEGSPLLLRNDTPLGNHWLALDLRGTGKNERAYGARVEVKAGDRRWLSSLLHNGSSGVTR